MRLQRLIAALHTQAGQYARTGPVPAALREAIAEYEAQLDAMGTRRPSRRERRRNEGAR